MNVLSHDDIQGQEAVRRLPAKGKRGSEQGQERSDLLAGGQAVGKGGGGPGGGPHAVGGGVIPGFQPPGQKSGHHGVPRAHGAAGRSRGHPQAAGRAGLVQQDGPIPGHGNQDVPGPLLLEASGTGENLLFREGALSEELRQLGAVGLDEEGTAGEDAFQQIPGGVHHRQHAPALHPVQNCLVHV